MLSRAEQHLPTEQGGRYPGLVTTRSRWYRVGHGDFLQLDHPRESPGERGSFYPQTWLVTAGSDSGHTPESTREDGV